MSCEKSKDDRKITEDKLYGEWELRSIRLENQYLYGPEEEIGTMKFTESHKLYCLGNYECEWSLDGNQLSFDGYKHSYFANKWTIYRLTSETLEAILPESDGATTLEVHYTFNRMD